MVKTLLTKFFGLVLDKSNGPSEVPTATSIDVQGNVDLVGFVNFVVRSLVEQPEEVSIDTEKDDRGMVIKITCNKSEICKIIGKQGKTINAIRALVNGAAKRTSQNVNVVVVE